MPVFLCLQSSVQEVRSISLRHSGMSLKVLTSTRVRQKHSQLDYHFLLSHYLYCIMETTRKQTQLMYHIRYISLLLIAPEMLLPQQTTMLKMANTTKQSKKVFQSAFCTPKDSSLFTSIHNVVHYTYGSPLQGSNTGAEQLHNVSVLRLWSLFSSYFKHRLIVKGSGCVFCILCILMVVNISNIQF